MNCTRITKSTRLFAGLLASLLFASLAVPLVAQPAPEARTQRPASFGYDKAHEITLNGTIQEVISKRIAGSPVGMHLLVAGSQGMVDAHLGPYLTKDTQEVLRTGEPVQIVGAMQELHGKDYLLARQLIVGGRTIVVRSEHGFLVRAHGSRMSRSKTEKSTEKTSPVELNGGTR
jgi:hypothetical protein